jgi:hypothetical protein
MFSFRIIPDNLNLLSLNSLDREEAATSSDETDEPDEQYEEYGENLKRLLNSRLLRQSLNYLKKILDDINSDEPFNMPE